MEDGRLPIEVFDEQKVTDDWPQECLTQMAKLLLGNDMPVSIEDGTPKEHSGSWHICISSSTETATSAVRGVLLEFENISDDDSDDLCGFGKHIHALADARDAQGRTALGLASKESREVIHEFLLFCGRYKLHIGPPEHRTATSVVLRAEDLGEKADYGAIFDDADKDGDEKLDRKELKTIANSIGLDPDMFLKGSEKSDESISKGEFVSICKRHLGDGPPEVVIKLMQKKDQWERECNARTKNTLHSKYVVSALSNVPSDAVKEDKGGLEKIVTKFLGGNKPGNYAIVMIAADRNLHEISHQEQPDTDAVRGILKQVFEAVKHLHGQKLMHGDIKMLNIVRFSLDNRLRLIDLDASARIVPRGGDDETFAGAKFSSAALPPEMIKRIDTEITDDAARDLVMQLLKSKPEERKSVASLLDKHPFFHSEMSAGTEDQFREMKEYLQNITNQVKIIHRNVLVIKKLSYESKKELLRTRQVLLKGIFEATEVRTPTTFIILNNKLPLAADPSDEEAKNKILKIIAKEDGSGVSMKTKLATLTATAEGVEIDLEGDLKEYRDQVEDGIKWAKAIKNIGTNFVAGNIDEAFDNIKDGIKDLIVGNEMYLYLIDDLTGDPVQAEGWPIPITTPSDVVPTLLPLMQLGMIGLSFYNGTAGMARLFGYPLPRVPKAWSKGAQETVELLKQESSVEEFSVLHEEAKEGSGEKKSVRGESLRIFMDFLEKKDPGRKDGKNGQFAGLRASVILIRVQRSGLC
eukprot:scaffold5328_cov198-Skeletonema_marinoi.AAC.1